MMSIVRTTLMPALLFTSAAFSQTITLQPKIGPPTSTVEVSGSGFAPGVSIQIYFGHADEASATADASGSFSKVAMQVPASDVPSVRIVTALPASGHEAQTTFTVYTDWRQAGFSPHRTGFNPYENVLNPSNVDGLGRLWSFNTLNPVGSSLALADGAAYVVAGGYYVYAVGVASGIQLWSYITGGGYVVSSPTVKYGAVYFGSGDTNVYALSTVSGAALWTFPTGDVVDSSPAVVNGRVFVGSFDANVYSARRRHWRSAVELRYRRRGGELARGSVWRGLYRLRRREPLCVDRRERHRSLEPPHRRRRGIRSRGSEWRGLFRVARRQHIRRGRWHGRHAVELLAEGGVISSLAIANGTFYFGSGNNTIYALNARNGTKQWSQALLGLSFSLANGVLYVGSGDGNVYALNAGTGDKLWSYATDGQVSAAPTVANGKVFIGSSNGNIYVLHLPPVAEEQASASDNADHSDNPHQ